MNKEKGIKTIQFTKDKEVGVSISIVKIEEIEKDKGVKVVLIGAGNPYKEMVLHTLLSHNFVGKVVCVEEDICDNSMSNITLEEARANSIKEYKNREPIEFVVKPRIDIAEIDIADILIEQEHRKESKKKGEANNYGYEKKQQNIRNKNKDITNNNYKTTRKIYSHRKK